MNDPAIVKAEDLIARSRKLQPSTRLTREKFIARIRKGKGPALPIRSVGYWRNYVAALQLQVAVLSEPLIMLAKEGDEGALRQIQRGVDFLDRLEATRPQEGARKPRQGRVKSLTRLREGWQEAIYSNLSEKWKPAFAVMALTGCRPAELNGLQIHPTENEGELRFYIEGRKVTELAGQEWRELTIDVRGTYYGRMLITEIGNEPGKLEIEETAQAITKAVTRAAQRAKLIRLDQTLPAYACRNALASGMKGQGWPIDKISAALGHSSDECQKFYGRANAGHKGGGGKVLDVKTARPVRETGRMQGYQSKRRHG